MALLVWSPLPELCFDKDHSTKNASVSRYELVESQLVDWPDFEKTVRETTRAYLGDLPVQIVPPRKELVLVGNEYGLMGRFGQHIAHDMTVINNKCSVGIRYGDFQTGQTIEREHEDSMGIPDWVLVDDKRGIRGVCEGKTFWTVGLDSSEDFSRPTWLGQLAKYMDDNHLAFGCFTTYTAALFLKRISDTTFQISPTILSTTESTETGGKGGVSLRECFLYLASECSRDSYRYQGRFGKNLTNKSLTQGDRRSPRLKKGKAKGKDETENLAKDLEGIKIEY